MLKKLLLTLMFLFGIKAFSAETINYSSNSADMAVLSNFRIENSNKNRVYFDSSIPLAQTSPAKKGFVISGKAIKSIKINSGQKTGHYFIVSSSFTFWDNNTIKYKGGSNVKIARFTLRYIENNIKEPKSTNYRYVSAKAKGYGNGLTESSPWTIQQAASKSKAGMTIWVKAGLYKGGKSVLFKNPGKINKPIKVIGYKKVVGDINSMYYNYGTSNKGSSAPKLKASEMPLFDGGNRDLNKHLFSFNSSSKFIIIKNIQVKRYRRGFYNNGGEGIIYDNLIAKDIGMNAHGYAITHNLPAKRCRILNSTAINASMISIAITGSYNLLKNSKSYCNETNSVHATDYYFGLAGENNIAQNTYALRDGNLGHSGHGFSIDSNNDRQYTKYNLIENHIAVNQAKSLELRHDKVSNNVVRGHEAYTVKGITGNGICIRDGAYKNIIENIYIHNVHTSVLFISSTEWGNGAALNNTFFNSVFTDFSNFMSTYLHYQGPRVSGNEFINCTINSGKELIKKDAKTKFYGNRFLNTTITNVKKIGQTSGFKFEYCNFYGGFVLKGNNNISVDPKFENISKNKYNLKSNSPLIDKGLKLNSFDLDFDLNHRLQGKSVDIGAFEYAKKKETSNVVANAGADVSICSGEKVVLKATGGDRYLWSTGATTQTIEVSPSITKTFTVQAYKGEKSDTDEVKVLVKKSPSVDVSSNKVEICSGQEVILTAVGEGDFKWNTGAKGNSITVNPSVTTKYAVSASNSCGTSDKKYITITVSDPIDLNVSDKKSICSGESVVLTANSNFPVVWSTGATTKSITVNPKSTTVYKVVASNSNCSLEKEITVEIVDTPSVNVASSKQEICSGEEVVLTATGEGDFTWSTGETGTSIVVSPSSTEKYSVTASSSCRTSVTKYITISVLEAINLNVTNDLSICSGESVTLTATSNESVVWSTGATTNSIVVNPTSTTTYKVSSSNSSCSDEKEVTVTVNSSPNVVVSASNSSICSGESVILTASGEGNFTWSTGETGSSITVMPSSTTKYTVTASSSCSASAKDDITITVNPIPELTTSGDVTIKEGESVTLSAYGTGVFLWSTEETAQNINVSPDEDTTYTVTLTNNNGSCPVEKRIKVTVVPVVEISANAGEDITVCKGKEVTLTASGGDRYVWSTGEEKSNIKVVPEKTTLYSVKVYKGDDYKTAYVTVFIDDSCGSEEEDIEDNFVAYPNPVSNTLNVDLRGYDDSAILSIVGLKGNVLYTKQLNNLNKTKSSHKFNFGTLSEGVYFVRLLNKGKIEVKKIIRI